MCRSDDEAPFQFSPRTLAREERRSGKANVKQKKTTFEIAVGGDRQENRVRHSRTPLSSARNFSGCAEVGCVLSLVRKVSAPCQAALTTGQQFSTRWVGSIFSLFDSVFFDCIFL